MSTNLNKGVTACLIAIFLQVIRVPSLRLDVIVGVAIDCILVYHRRPNAYNTVVNTQGQALRNKASRISYNTNILMGSAKLPSSPSWSRSQPKVNEVSKRTPVNAVWTPVKHFRGLGARLLDDLRISMDRHSHVPRQKR